MIIRRIKIMMLYSIEMLSKLAAYTLNAHKYNIVGQETNQINRRLQKNGDYLNTLLENALNERNQNVSIDQAKHENLVSADFDPFWRKNREKRKGAYELYKLVGTKDTNNLFFPEEDSPMYKAAINNKELVLPMGKSAAARVICYIEKNADNEIFWHRTWIDNHHYTVEATEYGLQCIEEIDNSIFSNSNIDLSGAIFSEYDCSDIWTNYTGEMEWTGSRRSKFYIFRYVNMFAHGLKKHLVGKPEYKHVNEYLMSMLIDIVKAKFGIGSEAAKQALAKEAFNYVFTDDATIFQNEGFEIRAELLAQLFAETWMKNQELHGEKALEEEVEELPSFEDDEDEFENELI